MQSGPAVPRGGLAVAFTDGSITNWVTEDQNGQTMNDLTTQNAWAYRIVDLSADAGKTVMVSWINEDSNSGAGNWDERFADISFMRADGTLVPVYNGQTNVSYGSLGSPGVTNQAITVEQVADGNQTNSTHFYLDDHLGTAQLEFASGGWPVWQGQFAPFGGELDTQTTANHYKFTGKERDSESGLDYFGARYYGSNMGRFMSPDPVKITPGRMANPQQLNLYSYVANNPLRFIDPDGETLQISGNVDEAQKQLCVLIGGDCSRISYNGDTHTITVNLNGIDLSKNEGASLLSDVVGSANTYSLTLDSQMLTAGGLRNVTNDDPVNLDNRPDERFRRGKDAMNLPPTGVDDAIGIDPNSRPLREEVNGLLVPLSSTIFHELAEAFAKVDGGEQYVMGHNQIGAHNEAVEREHVLRSQRPNMKLEGRAGSQLIRDPKPPKP